MSHAAPPPLWRQPTRAKPQFASLTSPSSRAAASLNTSRSSAVAILQNNGDHFASSPTPFFALDSLPSHTISQYTHRKHANEQLTSSKRGTASFLSVHSPHSAMPESARDNASSLLEFARLPESVLMRFEDENSSTWLDEKEESEGDNKDSLIPSLSQLTRRSRATLRRGNERLPKVRNTKAIGRLLPSASASPSQMNSNADSAGDEHSSRPTSRSSSNTTIGEHQHHDRDDDSIDAPQQVQFAPSARLPRATLNGKSQRESDKRDEEFDEDDVIRDDEDADLDDEDWSDEDDEDEELMENSDEDYSDRMIDDNCLFEDPPSPHESPDAFKGSKSAQASGHNAASASGQQRSATPSAFNSSLSIEQVCKAVVQFFTPQSPLGLSLSYSASTLALLNNNTEASDEVSLLFPSLEQTSAAAILLQNEGLNLPRVQQYLSLLFVFSSAWQDLMKCIKTSLELEGEDQERRQLGQQMVTTIWRLFLLAMHECVAAQLQLDEAPLEMQLLQIEQQEKEKAREMERKRLDRLAALNKRSAHANDRLMHHHGLLSSVTLLQQHAIEESKALEVELDIERRKEKDRNDEKKARLTRYQDWQKRARRAQEKRRMLYQDRDAMVRSAPSLNATHEQLAGVLEDKRQENAAFAALLSQLVADVREHEDRATQAEHRERKAAEDESNSALHEIRASELLEQASTDAWRLSITWLPAVRDRVRVMRDLTAWIELVRRHEDERDLLLQRVARAEVEREATEEEMAGIRQTVSEVELELAHEQTSKAALLETRRIKQDEQASEERALEALNSQRTESEIKHRAQEHKLHAVEATLQEHEQRWLESDEHLKLSTQAIESINAASVSIDRWNYARLKEVRLIEHSKERLDEERTRIRQGVESFEQRKQARLLELEARNRVKEHECVEMMQQVQQEEKRLEEMDLMGAALEQSVAQTHRDAEFAEEMIEQSKETRASLLISIETAKFETLALKENKAKMTSIHEQESALLVQMHQGNQSSLQQAQDELKAIEGDCASVLDDTMALKSELHELAIVRQSAEKAHNQEMAVRQDALNAIVRASVKHEDDFKAFVAQEKSKREALTRQGEECIQETSDLQSEQEVLSMRIARAQRSLEAESENARALQEAIEGQKLANQARVKILEGLSHSLNKAVSAHYHRARNELPARQTLEYLRAVNRDLLSIESELQAREQGRVPVGHAQTQTQ